MNYHVFEIARHDSLTQFQGDERKGKMSTGDKAVCVTGGSGYIASWLVKSLLQRGYTVNATVRDPNDQKKTRHLRAFEGATERLHLFKADLVEEGSFDSAFNGCGAVFHTASPVLVSSSDPQGEIINPAVGGTLNVLRSCAKFTSIKRVVMTSSMAAVVYTGQPLTSGVVVDETWFSNPAVCEQSKHWYALSKTLAEKAAWDFSKENRINLVVINPGHVIGPLLQPTVNSSAQIIAGLINGAQLPFEYFAFVDVRDVAHLHILALENPSASGRYCQVGETINPRDALKLLRKLYPTLHLPERCEDDRPLALAYEVSREKVEGLGATFTPLEVSVRDTVESLMQKGLPLV